MHIYAFGSLCRGEITLDSDIDLLAVTNRYEPQLNRNMFSIYSYNRICEIWEEGNPFSWHLYAESRMIFASNGCDFIKSLNMPNRYSRGMEDCNKFYQLFEESVESIKNDGASVFELSTIFLAIRNIATCYSLFKYGNFNFSRRSALLLGDKNISITAKSYSILERARILSTRGEGVPLEQEDCNVVLRELAAIEHWMSGLLKEVQKQ